MYSGSQLSRLRRIQLLIINPREAFTLLSAQERIRDAWWLFIVYFIVKTPAVVQNRIILGKLEYDQWPSVILGFIGGIFATALLLTVIAIPVHFFTNPNGDKKKKLTDTLALPALSLAPQLILVMEIPFILYNFESVDTMISVTLMRLTAAALTLRTFYWGLRVQFGVSRPWAIGSIGSAFLTMIAIAMILALHLNN